MRTEELRAVYMPDTSSGRPSTIMTHVRRHIEMCARTCYKSEDRANDVSSNLFVKRLIESGHTAMLEHGTLYLKMKYCEHIHFYQKNPYSIVNEHDDHFYITTNYRVVVENNRQEYIMFAVLPTEYHTRRVTIKFYCNRQISHEFVRHRTMSFAQESTRFCNYSKGRFGRHLTFIMPEWFKESRWYVKIAFRLYLKIIELLYFFLTWYGWSAEQAATILPNCLKTELVVTADVDSWKRFIELRLYGKTGKPHPQARELACQACDILRDIALI